MKNDETCVRIRPALKIFKGYPNLIPFISVFFILIIFFMLAVNFVPVQGFRVELPQANAEIRYAAKNMIVTVDSKANFYFNDTLSESPDMLKRRITEHLAQQPGVKDLIIRCDKNMDVNAVVQLLEIAKELELAPYVMVNRPSPVSSTNFSESEK